MHPGAPAAAPQDDWKSRRLGANPPDSEIALLSRAFTEVAAACGCPPVLFAESGDGTSRREAFRFFMHSTLEPIARLIALELTEKFETPIGINLDRLFAADLAGRARAFQSMVGAGMDVTRAATLAGLMSQDE